MNRIKRAFRRRRRGFTLMELLVSIVIMGVLSVAVWAVTNSAMSTFRKQENIVSSDDVKDTVLAFVRSRIRLCDKIYLTNQPFTDPKASELIKGYHTMFAGNDGRVYWLASNVDGTIQMTGESDLPVGSQALLSDDSYSGGKYGVSLKFYTIKNVHIDKYITIKVDVIVYEQSTASVGDGGVVTYDISCIGSDTFRLINIERGEGVQFDQSDADGYKYCYYV